MMGESFTLFIHGAIQSSESFQRERQTDMTGKDTSVKYTRSELDTLPDETDWERVDALTDEDIDVAASSDPAAPPTDASFWKEATVVMPENIIVVDADLLAWFKAHTPDYEAQINAVLRSHVEANGS